MNFEELQDIWNTQATRPLYSVNEAGLHAALWQQRQDSRRRWFRREILPVYLVTALLVGFIAINFLIFGVLNDGPRLTEWQAAALAVGAGAMLWFGTSMFKDRQQQERREDAFTGSLREELERGIVHVEYQIRTRRSGVRKSIPTYLAGVLVTWVLLGINGSSPETLTAVVVVIVLAVAEDYRRQKVMITRDLLPRKQMLESLLAKLTNPQT